MVVIFHNINFINVNSFLSKEKRDTYVQRERKLPTHRRTPAGSEPKKLGREWST